MIRVWPWATGIPSATYLYWYCVPKSVRCGRKTQTKTCQAALIFFRIGQNYRRSLEPCYALTMETTTAFRLAARVIIASQSAAIPSKVFDSSVAVIRYSGSSARGARQPCPCSSHTRSSTTKKAFAPSSAKCSNGTAFKSWKLTPAKPRSLSWHPTPPPSTYSSAT